MKRLTHFEKAEIAASIGAIDTRTRMHVANNLEWDCIRAIKRLAPVSWPPPSTHELCRLCVSIMSSRDPRLAIPQALEIWESVGKSADSESRLNDFNNREQNELADAVEECSLPEGVASLSDWMKAVMPGKKGIADRLARLRQFLKCKGPPTLFLYGRHRAYDDNEVAQVIRELRENDLPPSSVRRLTAEFKRWDALDRRQKAKEKSSKMHESKRLKAEAAKKAIDPPEKPEKSRKQAADEKQAGNQRRKQK